jgi:hypothetical protein
VLVEVPTPVPPVYVCICVLGDTCNQCQRHWRHYSNKRTLQQPKEQGNRTQEPAQDCKGCTKCMLVCMLVPCKPHECPTSVRQVPTLLKPQCMLSSSLVHPLNTSGQMPAPGAAEPQCALTGGRPLHYPTSFALLPPYSGPYQHGVSQGSDVDATGCHMRCCRVAEVRDSVPKRARCRQCNLG